jgi:hypothetical protein
MKSTHTRGLLYVALAVAFGYAASLIWFYLEGYRLQIAQAWWLI